MSIGNVLDVVILVMILFKVFILEFLGISGLVGYAILILIAARLLFGGWKVPLLLLTMLAVLVMLTALSYVSGSNPSSVTASYNIQVLLTPFAYLLFLLFLRDTRPSLLRVGGVKRALLFNAIYIVNFIVMLLQAAMPYSFPAAAPAAGQISFYQDLVSGFFMYASTHAVALFSLFAVLNNLNEANRQAGARKMTFIILAILVAVSALYVSTLNENKALFVLLPFGLLIYYAENLITADLGRVARCLIVALLLVLFGSVLYATVPTISFFVDENILSLLELIKSSTSVGTSAMGSNERVAIIQHALFLPSTWIFGTGLGDATLYEPYYQGFAHFGQSDFGSIVILLGIWYFALMVLFYVYAFAHGRNGSKSAIFACTLVALVLVVAIYAQCFSRTNNAVCLMLVCLALSERWEQVVNAQVKEKREVKK